MPPGIAARVDITPESVQHAAENFATGQQHLADAWMRLRSGLDTNAGMAGTGEPAKAFAGKYDAALKTIWKGFGAGIIHLGGTSKGLTQMANNHLKADHHSRADRPGGGAVKLPFARVYPSMSMAMPAPAVGRGGSGLPGPLAKLWPNAPVARLNAAAGVWRAAAKEIHSIGDWLNWTIGTITDTSSGPDIDAMYDYYDKVWTPGGGGVLGKLEDACSAMADACEQYAGKVRGARTKMKWELVGAGIGVALTTAGGLILTAPTGGGSDAAAGVADAAEVTAVLSPTAHELVSSVTAMMLSLLSGDIIGALTIALSTIPTITLIETEVEEELEPALEEEMAATEAGTAAAGQSGSIYSGNLIKVGKPDPDADMLAQRIGGESRVRFENDPSGREFDAVSDEYIAQAKPADFVVNKKFRMQAKATFDAAQESGRSVYYHFNGPPDPTVMQKLHEYSERYGVKVIIDTDPFQ